jgi:hypothetical protein
MSAYACLIVWSHFLCSKKKKKKKKNFSCLGFSSCFQFVNKENLNHTLQKAKLVKLSWQLEIFSISLQIRQLPWQSDNFSDKTVIRKKKKRHYIERNSPREHDTQSAPTTLQQDNIPHRILSFPQMEEEWCLPKRPQSSFHCSCITHVTSWYHQLNQISANKEEEGARTWIPEGPGEVRWQLQEIGADVYPLSPPRHQ